MVLKNLEEHSLRACHKSIAARPKHFLRFFAIISQKLLEIRLETLNVLLFDLDKALGEADDLGIGI